MKAIRRLAITATVGIGFLAGQTATVTIDRAPIRARYDNQVYIALHGERTGTPGPREQWVTVYDGTGKQVLERYPALDVPNTQMIVIRDASVSKNGILSVVASLWSNDGASGTAWFRYSLSVPASLLNVTRLRPITCTRIGVDDQENLWCLGGPVPKHTSKDPLVYRFSAAGKLIGSSVLPAELGFPEAVKGVFTGTDELAFNQECGAAVGCAGANEWLLRIDLIRRPRDR